MQSFEGSFQSSAFPSSQAVFSLSPNKYRGLLWQGHFLGKYLKIKCEIDAVFCNLVGPVFFIFQSQTVSVHSWPLGSFRPPSAVSWFKAHEGWGWGQVGPGQGFWRSRGLLHVESTADAWCTFLRHAWEGSRSARGPV